MCDAVMMTWMTLLLFYFFVCFKLSLPTRWRRNAKLITPTTLLLLNEWPVPSKFKTGFLCLFKCLLIPAVFLSQNPCICETVGGFVLFVSCYNFPFGFTCSSVLVPFRGSPHLPSRYGGVKFIWMLAGKATMLIKNFFFPVRWIINICRSCLHCNLCVYAT